MAGFKKCVIKGCDNKSWQALGRDDFPLCKEHTRILEEKSRVAEFRILDEMGTDWEYLLGFVSEESRQEVEMILKEIGS